MSASGDDKRGDETVIVRIEERVVEIVQAGAGATASSQALPGSAGEHRLQQKYGKTTHAIAFYRHQVLDHLNSPMQAFLGRQEMMFVGTADAKGHADTAFRCGHAGFVKVLDERTLAYPEYRGNGVMASLGNISENPHVALLFIDFGDRIGLHINGAAQIVENNEFLEFLKDHPAEDAILGDAVLKDIIESDGGHLERWVMVRVEEAYVQCSKHIPPMQRMDHDIQWGAEHHSPQGEEHHVKGGDYFGTAHGQK
jgi:predicted pyridoxine 5'-phosphate oxidase superfamily flavin-nucleotide-binding protein